MSDKLRRLAAAGVAIWWDDVDTFVEKDDEAGEKIVVVGVVVGASERSAEHARRAADVLRPLYAPTGGPRGVVTVELDPHLADSTEATLAEVKRIWNLVDRPNAQLAIPATEAGLPAMTAALRAGVGVNATWVFAPEQVRAVLDAFRAGLDGNDGTDGELPTATVSVSVSDVDTEVDKRLWAIGTDGSAALRGTAALANARLAYAAFENALRDPRWKTLRGAGVPIPWLAWTSTRVRDPYYLETRYVDELVADGVATVLSAATFEAVAESSEIRGDTIHGGYEAAHQALAKLTAIGIDFDDVYRTLRQKALDKSVAAWKRPRVLR